MIPFRRRTPSHPEREREGGWLFVLFFFPSSSSAVVVNAITKPSPGVSAREARAPYQLLHAFICLSLLIH